MREDFPQPFDFNRWFCSEYYSKATLIACRFTDLDPACDYALLSCQWHFKNTYGKNLNPIFTVEEILAASKKHGFQIDTAARVMHACWLSYVRWKKDDSLPPPVVILPPNPEPPVVVEPPKLPEVKLPQEKKNPAPTLVKFSVWFGILATAAGAASFFFPQAKPIVAIVVALVQSILKALGV